MLMKMNELFFWFVDATTPLCIWNQYMNATVNFGLSEHNNLVAKFIK